MYALTEQSERFREKMDQVGDFLRKKRLPMDLSQEILHFYKRMWKTYRTFSYAEFNVLDDLPEDLVARIQFAVNLELIKRVPLFAPVRDNIEFLSDLSADLKQVLLCAACEGRGGGAWHGCGLPAGQPQNPIPRRSGMG